MIFCCLLSVITIAWPSAANPSSPARECQEALTTAKDLPHPLQTYDVAQLTEDLLGRIQPGVSTHASFRSIERVVEPLMQNVTAFLENQNSSPILDRDEAAVIANQMAAELTQKLAQLKARRQGGRAFAWTRSLGAAVGEPTKLIAQIRYLHHGVLRLADELNVEAEETQSDAAVAKALGNAILEMRDALIAVASRLETADVKMELETRINPLADDLTLQAQALMAAHTHSVQRAKFRAHVMDTIRRLVNVVIPVDASMGVVHDDLSPLEPTPPPPGAKPEPLIERLRGMIPNPLISSGVKRFVRKVAPPVGGLGAILTVAGGLVYGIAHIPPPSASPPRPEMPPMMANEIVSFAERSTSWRDREDILGRYYRANKSKLSIDDVVKLSAAAAGIDGGTRFQDQTTMNFVREKANVMSLDDAFNLAGAAASPATKDDILIYYAQNQTQNLTSADLRRLGDAIKGDSNRVRFLRARGL